MSPQEVEAIYGFAERLTLLGALLVFIALTMSGRLRFAREVEEKDKLLTRLGDVVEKNSETTRESTAAAKEAVAALRLAVASLQEAEKADEVRNRQRR